MKKIERSAMVGFSAAQMYQLVNDIETYPQYMPGCAGAKIIESGEGWLKARLDLEKSGFKQSFTTRNTLEDGVSMKMTLVDGPFSVFEGCWSFLPLNESSCKVVFKLEFEFANRLLGFAANSAIEKVAGEQVGALCERAKVIYKEG